MMRNFTAIAIASLLFVRLSFAADSDIRLNTLGFLPFMPKKATITASSTTFSVKTAPHGKEVFSGEVLGPFHQDDVDQNVWIADFSQVSEPGRYYLDVQGVGKSFEFAIGAQIYDSAYYAAMRSFYLWRCGAAVEGAHQGQVYSHGECHMDDGYLDYLGQKGVKKDGTKGWHDAGDYGKYTVNAGLTLATLFLAWDHYQDQLETITLDLPETAAGYPEFLQELKWETDWLLSMALPDGSVSHKLTRTDFSGMIMPEKDNKKRYFTDWSTSATANFAAAMALAARHFKAYDEEYAYQCLEAAATSYAFLRSYPRHKPFEQGDFKTGAYASEDDDDRLWAAAELWETTGEARYLEDLEKMLKDIDNNKADVNWDWGDVSNLAIFTYVLSERQGRNPHLLADARRDIVHAADEIVETARSDVYGRPLGPVYYWGCNGGVARQVINLGVADRIMPNPAYRQTALDALAHLFGRNYYGRSFVTGVGYQPPLHPHDRRSAADGIETPWPGYLVGGGLSATNWQDDEDDYRTNEIAINWQAALVYALAGFIGGN